ncbi:hypothetical protein C8R46DRAFT_1239464 [Mycena filopes]|nr:hypothetical protein C8R46DRAFT_1239464 [Mycena filopes]
MSPEDEDALRLDTLFNWTKSRLAHEKEARGNPAHLQNVDQPVIIWRSSVEKVFEMKSRPWIALQTGAKIECHGVIVGTWTLTARKRRRTQFGMKKYRRLQEWVYVWIENEELDQEFLVKMPAHAYYPPTLSSASYVFDAQSGSILFETPRLNLFGIRASYLTYHIAPRAFPGSYALTVPPVLTSFATALDYPRLHEFFEYQPYVLQQRDSPSPIRQNHFSLMEGVLSDFLPLLTAHNPVLPHNPLVYLSHFLEPVDFHRLNPMLEAIRAHYGTSCAIFNIVNFNSYLKFRVLRSAQYSFNVLLKQVSDRLAERRLVPLATHVDRTMRRLFNYTGCTEFNIPDVYFDEEDEDFADVYFEYDDLENYM